MSLERLHDLHSFGTDLTEMTRNEGTTDICTENVGLGRHTAAGELRAGLLYTFELNKEPG